MEKTITALAAFLKTEPLLEEIAATLTCLCENHLTEYEWIRQIAGENAPEVLLALWEWKFAIPARSFKCGEWDSRILLAEPGESYEMPNISRALAENARQTGIWDSPLAIAHLFHTMGEPEWEKMPGLTREIRRGCVHHTISGAAIGAACARTGLKGKTGTMIAILKGAGIISPKLMAVSRHTGSSSSPLYEFNPGVYAEKQADL